MKIKHRERLLSIGDIGARKIALDIIEESLQALDVSHIIGDLLRLDGNILWVGNHQWDLGLKHRLFVIGAGKACNSMARAVEEKLGDRISEGLVIVKQIEPGGELQRIELVVGGHPLPNNESLLASKRILNIVEQATPDDLFISVISGGSSALMACPVSGITLEDEIEVTEKLLKSSARILEINAIRRHISATNGGRLAQSIEAKGAEMINLIISDVVGDGLTADPEQPVEFFGTPVAPDTTILQDAINVLEKYDLWSRIPNSIAEYLKTEDPTRETPKVFGDLIHHFVLQKPADACEAAKRAASKMGLAVSILTTVLEGESREAGTFLACVAKEISLNHRPIQPPCVLVAGGETTTRVENASGLGGPSQELALGFALEIVNLAGCSIAAIDTDGTDGPTEVAGGIADSTTVERARLKGLDVYERLMVHDSSNVLRILGDEIITGNTGTNVCDLNVIYIPRS
jgi:glycerate 2-kinase